MTLYFAYGSNLDKGQMRHRAPTAVPLGKFQLRDWRLVFRGVADVIRSPGDFVNGGIWKLQPEDEAALDRYEGVEQGMYRKVLLPIEPLGPGSAHALAGETHLLIYVMNSTGIFPPSAGYLGTIRQGYRDFELPMGPLHAAVESSYDDKAPSHIERQRHRRNGRPNLAPRPSEVKAQAKQSKKERKAKRKEKRNPPRDRQRRRQLTLDEWLAARRETGRGY